MDNQQGRADMQEISEKLILQIKEFEETVNDEVHNKPKKSEEKHITETSLQKFLQLFSTFTTACTIFASFYEDWKQTRQNNIKNLIIMADDLEKTTHKANISRVAGSSAGVAGAVLTIAGLITMPLTRKLNKYHNTFCSLFCFTHLTKIKVTHRIMTGLSGSSLSFAFLWKIETSDCLICGSYFAF